jgi:TPR repeat protein
MVAVIARERILPAKESPVVVAWDNPFPVFNPKKKEGKKKHSSLDKDMSKMNVSDQLQQRSQTSQSHRRGDESRPHTSQGHRRPEPLVNSSGLASPHPMSPTDRPPAMRTDSSRTMPTQRNFSDGQPPVRPPLNRLASDRPIASFGSEPAPRLQQSQRSMTLPDEAASGTFKKKLQKNQNAPSNQQSWGNRGGTQEPYTYVPAPISSLPVSPPIQQTSSAGTIPGEVTRNALISPEMPNFDAISPSANERTEDPLHVRTNNAKPAYQKAEYQAPMAATSLPRSQSQPDFQHGQASQPDFAGFTFDLPAGTNNATQYNQQPSQAGYGPTSTQPYDPLSPHTVAPNKLRSQSRAEQHPPRSASRQGQQPRSAGTVERYDSPDMHQNQYRSGSDAMQYTSQSQNRSAYRGPVHDYDQESFGPQQGRPGELAGGYNPRPSPDTQRPFPDQRQYPAQINTRQETYEGMRQHRSQTPNSAHPTPSRQYQSSSPSHPINPDALPAHPVPVRPGLMEKAPLASTAVIEGTRTPYQPPLANPTLTPVTSQETTPPPITAYDLNLLLQTIKNNPNDHETALTLAKKLVEAASVLANEGGRADAKTTQKNRERYIFDAHKYLKKLVHRGYPDAMFYLAECHGQGSLGLQVDPKEAFNLYTSAAKAGHGQAAYRVAVCCEMGNEEGGGTRRDPLKAMHWYKRAATMGDTPAMYKLGIILLKGLLGQARNPREAKSWLQRAADKADKDNPHALHELGLMHENPSPSDSIVKDEKYSLQLFTDAAGLGYKFSQFRLGSAYEYGLLGCPIDPRQSIAWYTRAAAQGEHQSELALSGWYLTGSDGILQQSDTEAYLWARKAASSGLAKAEYAMGYFTEVGIGCTANLDEAKKWYWRAACELSLSLYCLLPQVGQADLRFSTKPPSGETTSGGFEERWREDAQDQGFTIDDE